MICKNEDLLEHFEHFVTDFVDINAFLLLRVTLKAMQLPLFSFFFSTAHLEGLTKVACRIFYIC